MIKTTKVVVYCGADRYSGREGTGISEAGCRSVESAESPASPKKIFPWGEEDPVGDETDDNDDKHDGDDLVHCVKFSAVV